MKLSAVSHVVSPKKEISTWSPQDDFVLMMLVGKASYAQIALRLGRTAGAVQRRASAKGYSARQEWAEDTQTRKQLSEARREAILNATEEDLSDFLPECDEDPVLPHPGDRTYHKRYYHEKRKEVG